MPINSKWFPKQLDLAINKMWFTDFMEQPTFYDKVFKLKAAPPNGQIREAELSGIGPLRTKAEGDLTTFDYPIEGNDVTRTFTEYSLGTQITKVMVEDDYAGKITQMSKELGRSAAIKPDTVGWDLFNNGFATYTDITGNYLFTYSGRTALKVKQTISNAPQTPSSLTKTTFEAALDYFRLAINSAGRYIRLNPKWLIVPYTLDRTGRVLLETERLPGSMDNDVNTLKKEGSGIQILMVPYLTSSTAWFVLANEHDFNISWKRKATFETTDDFMTGNAVMKIEERFSMFCNRYEGGYGNAGA